ncbi:MAG: hypothetical protein JWP48_343 [Actinoallomurus sp.]|nr:hypothetical protein [Actinoallomurus sp.]
MAGGTACVQITMATRTFDERGEPVITFASVDRPLPSAQALEDPLPAGPARPIPSGPRPLPTTVTVWFDEGSKSLDARAGARIDEAVRKAKAFIGETGRSLRMTTIGFGNGYVYRGAGAQLPGGRWADAVRARLDRLRDGRAQVTGRERADAVHDLVSTALGGAGTVELEPARSGGRGPATLDAAARRRVEIRFDLVNPVDAPASGSATEPSGGNPATAAWVSADPTSESEPDTTDRESIASTGDDAESLYSQDDEGRAGLARWLGEVVAALEELTSTDTGPSTAVPDEALAKNPLLRALEANRRTLADQAAAARRSIDEARAVLAGLDDAGAAWPATVRPLVERLPDEADALRQALHDRERILRLQDTVVELRRLVDETVASGRTRRRLDHDVRRLELDAAREFQDAPGDADTLALEERSSAIRRRIADAVVRREAGLVLRAERQAVARRTTETLTSAREPSPTQVARSLETALVQRDDLAEITPRSDGTWPQRLAYFWLVHRRAQLDVSLLGLDPAGRREKRAELRILYLALHQRLSELLLAETVTDETVEAELAGLSDALLHAATPIDQVRRDWLRTGTQPWESAPAGPAAEYRMPAYLRGSLGPELVRNVAPELVTAFADEVIALLPGWLRARYTDRVRAQITAEWLAGNWANAAGGVLPFRVGPFQVTLWARMGDGDQLGDEIHVRPKHSTALTTGSRAARVHSYMSDATLNVAWALDAFGGEHLGVLDLHGHDAFAGVATWGWADHYEKPQSGYGMRLDQTVKGSSYRAVPFGLSVQAFAKVEAVGLPGFSWSRDNTAAAPILSNGVELAVSREVLYPVNEAARALTRSVFPGLRDGRWEPVPASRVARGEPIRPPRWSWVQAFDGARELAAAVARALGARPGSELERRIQAAITAETVIAAFPLARSRRGWEITLGAPGDGPNAVTVRFEFTDPGLVLRGDTATWADWANTLKTYQDVLTAHADMIDIPPTLLFAALQLYGGRAIGDYDPSFQMLTYAMPWVWREAVRVTSGLSGEADELSSVRLVGEPTALVAVKTRAVIERAGGSPTAVDLSDAGTTLRVLDRDLQRWFGDELPPLPREPEPAAETPEPVLRAPETLDRWWPGWLWIAEIGESLENLYGPLVDQINQRYPGALPYRAPGRHRRWVTSPIAEANLRALKRALTADQLATGLPRMRAEDVIVPLQWKQYAGLTRQVYMRLRARPVGRPAYKYRMPDGEQDFFTINTHDLTGSSEQLWGSWWGLQFVFGVGALSAGLLEATEFRPIVAARLAKTLGITSGHVLWSLFGAAIDDLAVFGQRVEIEVSLSADPVPRDPTLSIPGAYPPDTEDEGVIPGQHVVDLPEDTEDRPGHIAVTIEREDPNVSVTPDGRIVAADDISFTMPVQLTQKPATGADGQTTWVPFYDMRGDRPVWTVEQGPEWPDQSVLLPRLGGLQAEIEQAFTGRFNVRLPAWEQVRLADAIHLLAARIQDLQHPPAGDEEGWPIWEGKVEHRERDVLHGRWSGTGAGVRARARVVRAETAALADSFGVYNEYGGLDLHGLYDESGRGGQVGLRVRFPIHADEDTTVTPQPQVLRRFERNRGENSEHSGSRSRMTLDVAMGTSFMALGHAWIEFDFTLSVDGFAPDAGRGVTVERDGWFVHSSEQADELGLVPAHRKTGGAEPDTGASGDGERQGDAPEPAGDTTVAPWPGPRVRDRELYVPGWLLDGEHGIGNAGVYRSPRTREFAKKIYKKVQAAWGHHVAAELDKEVIKALSSAGSVAVIDGGLAFDVPLPAHFPIVRTGSLRVLLKGRLTEPGYQGISLDRFYSGFQAGAERVIEKSRDRRDRWAADLRGWIIHELHPQAAGWPNSFWYNHTYSYGTQHERAENRSDGTESKVSHTANDNSALNWFGIDFTADIELSHAPALLFDSLAFVAWHASRPVQHLVPALSWSSHSSRSLHVEHSQNGKAVQLHLDPHLMTPEPPPRPRPTVPPPAAPPASPPPLPTVLDRRMPGRLSDAARRDLGVTAPRRLRAGTRAGTLRQGFLIPAEALEDAQLIGLPGLDELQGLASDLMGAPGGESWFYAWGDIFRQLTSTITQRQLSGRPVDLFAAGGFAIPIREPGRFGGRLGTLTLAVQTLEFAFDTTTPEVMIRNLNNRASVVRTSGGRSKVIFHSPWALLDFQVGGRPIDGNNAAGGFVGVDHLGIDSTTTADRGTRTMLERGPKTSGRNVTTVGVKPTYLLIWQTPRGDTSFVEYTPPVDAENGALLRVPTEKLDRWRDAEWHDRRLGPALPMFDRITGAIGDAASWLRDIWWPAETSAGEAAEVPDRALIEGDYTVGYPPAYEERARRYADATRERILRLAPREGGRLTEDEEIALDAGVGELMEPHFRAALRHAGIAERPVPPNGDCFFETFLSDDVPASVGQRMRYVLGAEPTVAGIRRHMADFLAAEFERADRDPDAATVIAPLFPYAATGDPDARAWRAQYVDDIRRMGSYDNEASDRVPEMFSLIFGIPLDVWQPRFRYAIGWSPEDAGGVPLPVIRDGAHYQLAVQSSSREPTLRAPAANLRRAGVAPYTGPPVPEPVLEPVPDSVGGAAPTPPGEGDRTARFAPMYLDAPRPAKDPTAADQEQEQGLAAFAGRPGAGLLGGSRDAGVEPLEAHWPLGRPVTLAEPRFGGVRETEHTASAAGPRPTGVYRLSGRYPNSSAAFSYEVTAAGTISGADGMRVPGGGWVRYGDDFVQVATGVLLRGDSGWIGRIANWDTFASRLSPQHLPEYAVHIDDGDLSLVPRDASGTGRAVHLPLTVEVPAGTTAAERPGFGLGGVPAGVGWAQARWARSWGLRFGEVRTGSLYEAVLAANGGLLAVGDGRQVIRDADELRHVLSERMTVESPATAIRRWPRLVTAYLSAAEAMVREGLGDGELPAEQTERIAAQIDGGQAWQQIVASVRRAGHWDELESLVAPLLLSEYLGLSLLVVGADTRMVPYGSGPPLVVVATPVGSGGALRWAGAPADGPGPVLGGLTGRQVAWAADAGLRFVGHDRAGGDFFDALVTAGRVSGAAPLFGDAMELRRELVRRMRVDAGLTGPGDWTVISDAYVRARMGRLAGDGDPGDGSRAALEREIRRGLNDGDAWQEIIAEIQDPARGDALTGALLPLLMRRYLGMDVRVIAADGGDVDGPGVTLAQVTGGDGGGDRPGSTAWAGLAPVPEPRAAGAGTRPAPVAGGWSEPGPDDDLAGLTGETDGPPQDGPPQEPADPPGPAGLSARQWQWAHRLRRPFVDVPADPERFYTAVLRAAGGGFTDTDGVFVDDAAMLRDRLVERITERRDTDLELWLVVHTIYADAYRAARPAEREGLGPFGETEDRALTARIDARIDSGDALGDIVMSIADPGFWPELADELAPFFLNMVGLGVRVIDARGVVGRYGRGRPVYVAPAAAGDGEGRRRWVGLPPAATRYAARSRLAAPSLADPLLAGLSRAIDARKDALARTGAVDSAGGRRGVAAPWAADPVLGRLRRARALWSAHGAPVAGSLAGGTAQWRPEWLRTQIMELGASTHPAQSGQSGQSGQSIRAGLGLSFAAELADALYPPYRGGIHPAAETGDDAAGEAGLPGTGLPATEWVVAPSLSALMEVLPSGGTAFFVTGRLVRVLVDTTSGLRLVDFDPEETPAAHLVSPTPEMTASLAAPVDGLALVVGPDGVTVPAEALGARFTPATCAPVIEELLAELDELPAAEDVPVTGADAAPPNVSRRQYRWTREHRARFAPATPGSNSFFDAVIKAAGGRFAGVDAAGAPQVRAALAQHVRDKAAEGGLRDWPLLHSAYVFEAEERIVEDFFGQDIAAVNPQALHGQISDHVGTGEAWDFIASGIARPGHWEEITARLAPALLAEHAGLSLLVIEPDGQVRHHGDPAGRRLVVARTSTGTGTPSDWVAVVPETGAQEDTAGIRPFEDAVIDVTGEASPAKYAPAGRPAALTGPQQRTAEDERLWVQPTEPGVGSFFDAVLTAAGGGVLLDRETYVDSPARLRDALASLFRDRPDVLDPAARRQVHQVHAAHRSGGEHADHLIATGEATEEIIDALRDPADPLGEQIAPHLVGPYLGVELHVIGPDGDTTTHGAGRPITIAPAVDPYGGAHWAALIPRTTQAPPLTGSLPGLPELPQLTDLGRPLGDSRWSAQTHRLLPPGSTEVDDPWRDSTYSKNKDGESLYCVSVAVVTVRPAPGSIIH